MVKTLTSRSQFARECGVSPAAITKACGTLLVEACVGSRIDSSHPAAVAYFQNRNLAADFMPEKKKPVVRGRAAKNQKAKAESAEKFEVPDSRPDKIDPPDDIREFTDMTLRELIDRFGTDIAFADWLKATKSIEDINEKRLKNAVTQGELVSRELVKIGIIEPIDSAHRKLLTDGAKTIARRSVAMRDSGQTVEEIETFVIDQISSFIRPIKPQVARALRDV